MDSVRILSTRTNVYILFLRLWVLQDDNPVIYLKFVLERFYPFYFVQAEVKMKFKSYFKVH